MMSIFDSNELNENLFFPRPDNLDVPEGVEDIFVQVDSSCKLHIRRHLSPNAKFSIIFFHGNGEIVSDYDAIAKNFTNLGCEFIVCDYRGYGKSDGIPTLKSLITDASKIYCYLRDNNKLKINVCVMGRSLGSAAAIELCSKSFDITCCVIESGYADPIQLVKRRGLEIKRVSLEENKLFNNSEKMLLVNCPTLVMHGENDFLISPQEAILNHKNSGSRHKVLDILKSVGHNDMMMASDNAYFKSLINFFNDVIPL